MQRGAFADGLRERGGKRPLWSTQLPSRIASPAWTAKSNAEWRNPVRKDTALRVVVFDCATLSPLLNIKI